MNPIYNLGNNYINPFIYLFLQQVYVIVFISFMNSFSFIIKFKLDRTSFVQGKIAKRWKIILLYFLSYWNILHMLSMICLICVFLFLAYFGFFFNLRSIYSVFGGIFFLAICIRTLHSNLGLLHRKWGQLQSLR